MLIAHINDLNIPMAGTTITLERLKRRGYKSFLEYYLEISRGIGTGY